MLLDLSSSWLVLTAVTSAMLLLLRWRAYPRPLRGIPYNFSASKKLMGDLDEIGELKSGGKSMRPWFLEQAYRHQSAICQIFLGPFSSPAILLSDYREVNDILMHGDADFKRGKKVDVFSGILPHAHPAMETFDPRFKSSRALVKDLMAPTFLNSVNAPRAYDVSINLLKLWRLKAQLADGKAFNVANDIVEFSFDAILSAATGLGDDGGDVNRQIVHLSKSDKPIIESSSNNQVATFSIAHTSPKLAALGINEESLWKGFYMPWPRLYHRINNLRPSVRKASATLKGFIEAKIKNAIPRLTSGGPPLAALDYVIQRELKHAEAENRPPSFADPRLRDEIYGYLIAGHDTSTGSLLWLVRRLMVHLDVQGKVRANLRETYSVAWAERRLPTANELMKRAPYLDAFIEEVLRINCPVVTIMMNTRRDTLILGHSVPQDTAVFLNLTGPSLSTPSVAVDELARSETSRKHNFGKENWDDFDPSSFRPERWLKTDEKTGQMVFDAAAGPTLSFSAGNRGCWGKRLGYLELRIVLTILIWSFNFEQVPKEIENWDTYDSLVTAPKECYLRLSSADGVQ